MLLRLAGLRKEGRRSSSLRTTGERLVDKQVTWRITHAFEHTQILNPLFTQTLNHTREQVAGLLDSIATHLADFDIGPEIVVDLRSDVPAVETTE